MALEEITPGIYRLKIPLPHKDLLLGYVNCYLIKGDEGYALFDTGWGTPEAFESLKQMMGKINAKPDEIKLVLSTHIHPDHYGLSGKIKEHSGAKVIIHRNEAAMVGDRYVTVDTLMKKISDELGANGVPETYLDKMRTASVGALDAIKPATPDSLLEGGELIRWGAFNLKIIATPGHSWGHVCIYEPARKILFTGDHMLPTISSHIGLHPQSQPNPLDDYLKSLKMLTKLEVDLILPGHENPFSGVEKRVAQLHEHHAERLSDIMSKIDSVSRTAFDIADRIIWLADSGGISFNRLSFWDQRLAMLETLAHLEYLMFEGKVTKNSRDSLIYFKSA